ncbi:MAG: hypothetical protein AAF141_02660 [Pseudomonadota bacterium]
MTEAPEKESDSNSLAQIDKFRQAASDLEADESTERFENDLRKIVKPPDADKDDKSDKEKPAD